MDRSDLHTYQNFCIQFLKEHPEALLILEMGLRKSIVSLTAILDLMFDSFDVSKVLIVGPLRVVKSVWPKEKELWDHTTFLKMSLVNGTAKQREAALEKNADIYVINRENLSWLVDRYEGKQERWPFDMVVLDELSSFKNHSSRRWKAVRRIRPYIKRIVGLTGTPAPNGLMDLWAQVYLIDKGQRLGRFIGPYRTQFFKPESVNPVTGIVYRYALLPGAEDAIYKKIGDITVSMKALDHLDMPECTTVQHTVKLSDSERKAYESLKKDMLLNLDGQEIDASNAAVLSGKLLQLSGGSIYDTDGKVHVIHDRKLEMLEDLLEQANGQSVLIACWFRHEKQRIVERLHSCGYEVRELLSSKDIDDWNNKKIPVGIISPASAAHGLNLQKGGHILIWYTPVWSLELYQQTNARLYRQGQKDVVTIHHIIAENTIDSRIIKVLGSKEHIQESLIEAVKAEFCHDRYLE